LDTMRWLEDGCLELLDQTALPSQVIYLKCRNYHHVAQAILRLAVRGAPAIGAAAAYGLVLGAQQLNSADKSSFLAEVGAIAAHLSATRPTAVNLNWALNRMQKRLRASRTTAIDKLKATLLEEAHRIYQEDLTANRSMGQLGQELLPKIANVLTICNAGALATAGYGTALGVIRAAWDAGKRIGVFACETRPLLQGARLTTWELQEAGIPVTLITDGMAGYLMASGKVDLVIVGADRIAANGDTANKIGTYGLAVLAKHHNLPFYVAAPLSTIDETIATGKDIPIEEREKSEVLTLGGHPIAPPGTSAWNPAFDTTPNHLISAIITESGVIYQNYRKNIARTLNAKLFER